MKTIKVSEATNLQLDWLVAKCEGKRPSLFILRQTGRLATEHHYTTDPAQMWPIIEREKINIEYDHSWEYDAEDPDDNGERWCGIIDGGCYEYGSTALIAAARCYGVSKLGETVLVPEELG